MQMTCEELFGQIGCTILGNPDEEITGLSYRSQDVKDGDAFFCIVGTNVDGHSFAQDAIDRGAKVLVVERKVYLADATDVTEIVVGDSRRAMAEAAHVFYGQPSHALDVVGITGTNGKTTTTYITQHLLSALGKPCGVVGTLGATFGLSAQKTNNTTPESVDLAAILADMASEGCKAAAIEVSSHALDLLRVWSMRFAVTAFTNLTQDHLDYHHTFEAYFEAKARLFTPTYPAKRVITIDDNWGLALAAMCRAAGDEVITCGFNDQADLHPAKIEYQAGQTNLDLYYRGKIYSCTYPLVGKFNVANVLTALGCVLSLGYELPAALQALQTVEHVPGRLEHVSAQESNGISVYVDYAHTPDALEKALGVVREITDGKVFVVFGCGGDRDASKRSIMGQVALKADFAVVTSDNPRTEDPQAIIDDILSGMEQAAPGSYAVEPDRRSAIALAIARAQVGDAILIAGKGHEDYQIIGTEKFPFDDRVVARQILEESATA